MSLASEIISWDCRAQVSDLCSELIRIPSVNPPGEMEEIAAVVEDVLRKARLTVERIIGPSGQPSVIGRLDFGDGPTLLLNGHMDVVSAGDINRWSWDPFGGEERDGYILGRGASDMKGGLAALLVALSKVSELSHLHGRIVFMAVPDEETGGMNGTRYLLEQGITGNACLIAEPSGINPTIGQKGNLWLEVVSHGVSAHGSLSPAVGVNAIRTMNRVIDALYRLWEIEWPISEENRKLIAQSQQLLRQEGQDGPAEALARVSVNVGIISGGDKVNMVPSRCEAQFDMRVPIGVSSDAVLQEIDRVVQKEGGNNVEVKLLSPATEANVTPPTDPFVQIVLRAIQEVRGGSPQPMLQWASSDARYFRYRGIPTVQYGPAELDGIHGYNERVRVEDLVNAARIYALLIAYYLSDQFKRM